MTAQPKPADFKLERFLRRQESKSLLRLIACGSVDHGKSTLIGRLLYESNLLLEDQIDALKAASRKNGTQGEELDFSLVLDGLAAEIEQKITIDVAYRFFSTERRKFIVADAPGHEQYTRNMATGASTADLALILVSAGAGITRQTKRHSLIVSTLGVRNFVLAVNKMDLIGWSEPAFHAIEADFRALAESLGVHEVVCIPMSASAGENVVRRSRHMDWYRGPTLAEYLDQVEIAAPPARQSFCMPVQWVNRPDPDFRGYSGMILRGAVQPGEQVRILPSGQTSQVARIVTYDGDRSCASAGQSVTLALTEDIDVSRGDLIVGRGPGPEVSDRLSARVIWMGGEPLAAGRSYLLKLASSNATATIAPGLDVLDLDGGDATPASVLAVNEIGRCTLLLDRAIAAERYVDCRETGSFILIDPETFDTVGMGFVDEVTTPKRRASARWPWLRGLTASAKSSRAIFGHSSETRARSIVKAMTWRGTGSLDTFLLSLIITGSGVFATSIAATEVLTKIVFYYLHERGWSMISWGRN